MIPSFGLLAIADGSSLNVPANFICKGQANFSREKFLPGASFALKSSRFKIQGLVSEENVLPAPHEKKSAFFMPYGGSEGLRRTDK
jgi:hypothetical protein